MSAPSNPALVCALFAINEEATAMLAGSLCKLRGLFEVRVRYTMAMVQTLDIKNSTPIVTPIPRTATIRRSVIRTCPSILATAELGRGLKLSCSISPSHSCCSFRQSSMRVLLPIKRPGGLLYSTLAVIACSGPPKIAVTATTPF